MSVRLTRKTDADLREMVDERGRYLTETDAIRDAITKLAEYVRMNDAAAANA